MANSLVEDVAACVGFTSCDAADIRALGPFVEPVLPDIVDGFYDQLMAYAPARAVFTGGPAQTDRLRQVLRQWLLELFLGDYGSDYVARRLRIGQVHLDVGLPQHYMTAGIEIVWQHLERRIRGADIPDVDRKLRSLHKRLMLELAIMLQSYQEAYGVRVRETERSVVEEKLTRAEHLAEIGQLAASLAHEIKNPLAGISGAIQIIGASMDEDHPHRAIVSEILGQIRRLDDAVKDLLVYARPTPPKLAPVAVHEALRSVMAVLGEEPALDGVMVVHDGVPELASVLADRAQIEQLVMNLIINAAHASKPGDIVRVTVTTAADRVRIVVEDNGVGMDAQQLSRAFEPFYTTKAKGTGLGLPICRRIVEAHGGTIRLDSKLGEGTRVAVELPGGSKGAPQALRS